LRRAQAPPTDVWGWSDRAGARRAPNPSIGGGDHYFPANLPLIALSPFWQALR